MSLLEEENIRLSVSNLTELEGSEENSGSQEVENIDIEDTLESRDPEATHFTFEALEVGNPNLVVGPGPDPLAHVGSGLEEIIGYNLPKATDSGLEEVVGYGLLGAADSGLLEAIFVP
ncbi:hypothetical protein F0562_003334 [Nyssa sinensis]|uniref:Uncharacterized protein n=1 Tax=Nyssa sinensis TaxID=561372 RepID=A0A5J5BV44_9ASTE|nr:hypothetical protein F0562_003334 [Nyssa sinensis]